MHCDSYVKYLHRPRLYRKHPNTVILKCPGKGVDRVILFWNFTGSGSIITAAATQKGCTLPVRLGPSPAASLNWLRRRTNGILGFQSQRRCPRAHISLSVSFRRTSVSFFSDCVFLTETQRIRSCVFVHQASASSSSSSSLWADKSGGGHSGLESPQGSLQATEFTVFR